MFGLVGVFGKYLYFRIVIIGFISKFFRFKYKRGIK